MEGLKRTHTVFRCQYTDFQTELHYLKVIYRAVQMNNTKKGEIIQVPRLDISEVH